MTFPSDERPERRHDAGWVTHAELLAALTTFGADVRDARHDQTNRITSVIADNHRDTNEQIQRLRVEVLSADAEPQATPAGRRILERLAEIERVNVVRDGRQDALELRVDSVEDWRSQLRGAFKLVNIALGTSVLAAFASIVAIWKGLT